MKIIFAIPDMGSGGAERVISVLCENFTTQNISVEILMLFGGRRHYQLPPSIKIRELNLLQLSAIKRVYILRNIFKDLNSKDGPISVYAFHDSVLKYLLVASIGFDIRIISSERNNPYVKGKSWFSRLKASIPYLLSSHTVFQTPAARKYYFLPQYKCSVIPNPITEAKHAWTGDLSPEKLVSICRLHSQKNIPMSLRAINILKDRLPNIHLDIYGEGNLKDSLHQQIIDMGLSKHVSLQGVTNNVTKVLSESSIFISTSDFEGISNSMLEAMSVGMPVLCTDCPIGGASMMIGDDAGLLSKVGDAEAFAKKLFLLLSDKEMAHKLAANAKSKSKNYSLKTIAQKWLSLAKRK